MTEQPQRMPQPQSAESRKARLAQVIAAATAGGARIESSTDYQAVIVRGKPVNHVLHLLVTLFTCGLWVIVWLLLAVTGGEKREVVAVDEFGNIVRR